MARAQRKGDIGAKQYADDHIQNLVGVGHTFRICVSNFSIYKKRPCFQRFVKTGAFILILILNQPIDKLSAIISSFCVKLPCQATACLRSLSKVNAVT